MNEDEKVNIHAALETFTSGQLLFLGLTKQKLGLYWESSAIERDTALNANIVLPRLVEIASHGLNEVAGPGTPNLIIEGDKNLRNEAQPLSSWIAEVGKSGQSEDEDSVVLTTGMTSEGTKLLRAMDLDSAFPFPYPKPLSHIQGLPAQASRPGDHAQNSGAKAGNTDKSGK